MPSPVLPIAILSLVDVPGVADIGWAPRWTLALILVLTLPGYFLVAAAFPGLAIGIAERLVLSLGTSLAMTVIVGLVLDRTPWGLTTASWGVALLGATAIAATMAWLRAPPRRRTGGWSGLTLTRREGVLFGAAAVVTIIAAGVAYSGARYQPSPGFTQLWLMPADDQDGPAVQVGIRNMERGETTYTVVVSVDGMAPRTWAGIAVGPEEVWEVAVRLPAVDTPVAADLYRADAPGTVYRRVFLGHPTEKATSGHPMPMAMMPPPGGSGATQRRMPLGESRP